MTPMKGDSHTAATFFTDGADLARTHRLQSLSKTDRIKDQSRTIDSPPGCHGHSPRRPGDADPNAPESGSAAGRERRWRR